MFQFELFKHHLSSPMILSFLLGVFARGIRSPFRLPKDLYQSLAIYLLFSIGLKGGVELSVSSFAALFWPAMVTLLLGCVTPLSAYFFCRQIGQFSPIDSAALAAHYGSVSAVTFIGATQFVNQLGLPSEGFMLTLLTLLESPGIQIAVALGLWSEQFQSLLTQSTGEKRFSLLWKAMHAVFAEVIASQSMILLVGGLFVGYLMEEKGYEPIRPFFDAGFKGALCLFLLEMGITAGGQLTDLKQVQVPLIFLSIFLPLLHGSLGVFLGSWAGLSIGGSTILGTMAASASYIAAPSAVQIALPSARLGYCLTASLALTFPFNMIIGIPLYYRLATWFH